MASIYPRGKTYWIKYYKDGVCYRESLKTQDRKTANYRLSCKEKELAEGEIPVGLKKINARLALNEYLENAKLLKGPQTLKVDIPRLTTFLMWGKIAELKQINHNLIADYLSHRLREEKVKPLTYNHTLSIIKTWLNWCIKRNYISHNPAQAIKKLRIEPAKVFNQRRDSQSLIHCQRRKYQYLPNDINSTLYQLQDRRTIKP